MNFCCECNPKSCSLSLSRSLARSISFDDPFFLFEMQTVFDFKSIFAVHSFLLFVSRKPRLYHFTFEIQQCTYALNLYAHMNVIFCEVSCQRRRMQVYTCTLNGIRRLFSTHKLHCYSFFHYFSRVALFFFCSLINYSSFLFVAFVPTITNLTN